MFKFTQKDLMKRKKVRKNELKRLMYKYIIKNININKQIRYTAMCKLNKLKKNSVKTRIINTCILTGRKRGVYKFFRLSRIKFRELAQQSLLPGVAKASW